MPVYADLPPLREEPFTPDAFDEARANYIVKRWTSQDEPLRRRDRQIEENLRMLAGQQWMVWNPWLQKFMDVTEWMTDDERRWRQRPVINRLLYWFILTHSRFTENPPIVTFEPANGARLSAMLAEVMDTVWKSQWRETWMSEVIDRLVAWLIPGGRAHLQSVLDPHRGDLVPWVGTDAVPVVDEFDQPVVDAATGEPALMEADEIPFDREGNPLARFRTTGELEILGEPHVEREGGLRIDVLSPLQVRGQWGPMPWHEKRWHAVRSFLTPEEVWEIAKIDLPPDNVHASHSGSDPGFLERVFFGSGYYGAASAKPGSEFATEGNIEGYVEVLTMWERPCDVDGLRETLESPGGRLMLVARTSKKLLVDSVRPFRFKYTSGIRCFDFVNIPGRPSGTTPQEMLNPLQRSYNRFTAQIMENANLIANPIGLIDGGSGLQHVEMTNKPGSRFVVNKRPGVLAFEYVQPPSMSRDVYQSHALLKTEMQELGYIEGAEGAPPTEDPSGKLVKELRFNSDRFVGGTSRRTVEELARMGEDWKVILEVAWDQQKVVSYGGEDAVARTVTVLPEMFREGTVNVIGDVESMLPESRAERQNKMFQLWQSGAWGPPDSPPAVQKFLEVARFPHMSRMAWPGGVHLVTAQQENGRLVTGSTWEEIPVLEWYDDQMHLHVHETFMSSPEYLKLDPEVQQHFVVHRQMHLMALQMKTMRAVREERAMQEAAGGGPGRGTGGGSRRRGGNGKKQKATLNPRKNPQGGELVGRTEGA